MWHSEGSGRGQREKEGHSIEMERDLYNWGEPHINGTAVRKLYIIYYILWYVGHAKLYPQHGSIDINAKYSTTHCHAWAIQAVYKSF